ncbi:MAG: tripartite tricarboxylate transporter substrate binding protein, partial [Chloroflexota bacterium]|nr:tripartite tricarboxylate transporter substrate binding protein [Chloroflexota bacterium]
APARAVASAWRPNGSVELVVPYAPGGGSSITALEINKTVQENNLLSQPFNITNKPGASGSVGLAYVIEKRGDPLVLATGVDSGLITNKLAGTAPFDFEDLTPISLLAVDEVLIATQASSQFQSIQDLIEFAKANPGQITAGGTGATGTERLAFQLLEQATGTEIEYVPFNSGAEVNAALLGGHIDIAASNPNEFFPQIEAGNLRPLVTLSRERVAALPNTPTMVELGYPNAILQLGRGIVGPPGMPPEAVEFYEDLFRRVAETQVWKDYVQKNSMTLEYRDQEAYIEYLRESRDRMRELMESLEE